MIEYVEEEAVVLNRVSGVVWLRGRHLRKNWKEAREQALGKSSPCRGNSQRVFPAAGHVWCAWGDARRMLGAGVAWAGRRLAEDGTGRNTGHVTQGPAGHRRGLKSFSKWTRSPIWGFEQKPKKNWITIFKVLFWLPSGQWTKGHPEQNQGRLRGRLMHRYKWEMAAAQTRMVHGGDNRWSDSESIDIF